MEQTAMQDLKKDLIKSIKKGENAINEIDNKIIRDACKKTFQLTMESVIKRIDDELLEKEKTQIINAWTNGKYIYTLGNEDNFEDAEQYYNETFKSE